MTAIRQNVPLTETFAALNLDNYSTFQATSDATAMGRTPGSAPYAYGLSTQEHVDIRTFNAASAAEPENWSVSGSSATFTTGKQSGLNNWLGLNASLPVGTTTFTSTAGPVDLTQIPDGNIVLALPGYVAGSINAAQSTLGLSDGTQTVWRTFASSTTPVANGNTTATWPVSAIANSGLLNMSAVTEIQLNVVATSAVTFQAMALRLVGPEWIVSNVDFDTWNNELRQSIPLNGDTAYAVPTNQHLPIIWRSATAPGVDDPRPINGEFGVLFNTGSQTQQNSFTLYMRGETQAYMTQLDLEGSTQASLTGRPQPTEGVSEYSPRTIGDLEQQNMGQLDSKTMIDLERMDNPVYQSWVSFNIRWGSSNLVQINNSSNATSGNAGYQYALSALANNTTYLMTCSLTDNAARLQIWSLNQSNLVMITPVFDTTVIPDSSMFPRQAGRVGWSASLLDGDTYIKDIRPRGLTFAEYKSKSFQSLTPVSGARLYAQYTPDTDLFTAWSVNGDINGNVPTVSTDRSRYVSTDKDQQSTKVTITNPSPGSVTPQGIVSNWLSPPGDSISGITNFDQLGLDLSVWVPSTATRTVYTNYALNPSFEYDASGTAPAAWGSGSMALHQTSGATLTVTSAQSYIGSHSLQIATSATNGGQGALLTLNNSFIVGQPYTFSFYAKGTTGTEQVRITFGGSGSNLDYVDSGLFTLTTSWQQYSVTWTPSTSESPVYASFHDGPTQTATFYMDAVMINAGSTPLTFFSGDTSGYLWTGVPGDSASATNPNSSVLTAALINKYGYGVLIDLPTITPDQWSSISLMRPIVSPYPISGPYQLALYYNGGVPTTFWVDSVHVTEPAVTWDARSVVDDPWNSNYAPWTPFRDTVNSDVDGVKFTTTGLTTQVRGQAHRQDAAILSNPTLVPQYAQLGRLVWPEDTPILPPLPTPNFVTSNVGRTFTFSNPLGGGNLVTNPSFEYDTLSAAPATWRVNNALYSNGGGTVTTSAVQNSWSANGTQSWRVTGSVPPGKVLTFVSPPELWSGGALTVLGSANVLSIPTSCYIGFAYFIEDPTTGALISSSGMAWNVAGVALNTVFRTSGNAAGNILGVITLANNDTVTHTVDGYVDSLAITSASGIGASYVDGDTPGYLWAGTPGASITKPSTGAGNFFWSFGDGTYGTGSTVTHTYPSYLATGSQFMVTLTYVNQAGQSVSAHPYLVTLP